MGQPLSLRGSECPLLQLAPPQRQEVTRQISAVMTVGSEGQMRENIKGMAGLVDAGRGK